MVSKQQWSLQDQQQQSSSKYSVRRLQGYSQSAHQIKESRDQLGKSGNTNWLQQPRTSTWFIMVKNDVTVQSAPITVIDHLKSVHEKLLIHSWSTVFPLCGADWRYGGLTVTKLR